jgi:hypothetical protein
MANATDYLEREIINTYLRGQATYVALCTANPTDAGSNEVQASAFPSYARQLSDGPGAAGSGWSDPGSTSGATANTNKLTFPSFDGTTDLTVTHWMIFDAATGGNPLIHAPLSSPRTLRQGDRLIFDPSSLSVTIA